MSSSRRLRSHLVADTVWGNRRGIVAWTLGSLVAMVSIAAGFRSEASRVEGGGRALAETMQVTVQAMRLLRWPADRLDTLGGYLTYHNVTLVALFLTVYAAVKGANSVRGAEAGHSVEVFLATGESRTQLIHDRAIGFAAVLFLLAVGLGAGIAAAMVIGAEPDVGGSFLTGFACAACAFVGYGLGSAVAQLSATARSASAATSMFLVAAYLFANVWDQTGPLASLRFISPFYYFTQCRALVPGAGFNWFALLVLVILASVLVVMAGRLFQGRDVGSARWVRATRPPAKHRRVQSFALSRLSLATLVRDRGALLVWSMASAAGLAMMAWLEPQLVKTWNEFEMTRRMLQVDPGFSPSSQYLGFVAEMAGPITAAFVVSQAANWVGDLESGRFEMFVATPLSRISLIRQRLIALLVGTAIVVTAAMAGLLVGAIAVDARVSVVGALRMGGTTLLFAASLGAVAAWLITWAPRFVVTALSIVLGGSYLLMFLVPMFDWPEWLTRLSLFGALDHPYLEFPAWGGLAFLAVLGVGGYVLAAISASTGHRSQSNERSAAGETLAPSIRPLAGRRLTPRTHRSEKGREYMQAISTPAAKPIPSQHECGTG